MDKQKLNLIVSVICMFLFIILIRTEMQKVDELKAVRTMFNETDYSCCAVYRSHMMRYICQGHPYNYSSFQYPTIMNQSQYK